MGATFEIKTTFELSTRLIYVLGGTIMSGKVSKGMVLVDESKGFNIEIASVEYIDSKSRQVQVGLTFSYRNDDELNYLNLFKPNDIITLR